MKETPRRTDDRLHHERRLAAIGMQASGIAHDFNNVLSVILGYGERALNDATRGSQLWHDLDCIVAAGKRARSLVEQVLVLGRNETAAHTTVDINMVVREALELIVARLPSNITIEPTFGSGLANVYGNATGVHRLVMNLALNAIQAMPQGGPLCVSVSTERIADARSAIVGWLSAREYVVLRVTDRGVGIAPETVRRIFDQFFTTREGNGGTGLGLSIVREIVIEAGGAIEVESRVDVGSRISVYLPRARAVVNPQCAVDHHQHEARS